MGIPAARGGWREAVQRLPPEHGVECGRAQIREKYVSAVFSKLISVTKARASCSGALVKGLSLVELPWRQSGDVPRITDMGMSTLRHSSGSRQPFSGL